MILNVILLLIFIIWIFVYIKNKKAIRVLPYLLMLFITPFYNILDSEFFVEIFGCGCVPIVQTNMFNIDFNANDLRFVVYNTIAVLMLVLGIVISKNFKTKKAKIIYNITIFLFNIILAYIICRMFMWA